MLRDEAPRRVGQRGMRMQGQRTLDFVLKSKGFIDKTLLIDIELLRLA